MDYVDYSLFRIRKVDVQHEMVTTIAQLRCPSNTPFVYETSTHSLFLLYEDYLHKYDLNSLQQPPPYAKPKLVFLTPSKVLAHGHKCLTTDNQGKLYSINRHIWDISIFDAKTLNYEGRVFSRHLKTNPSFVVSVAEVLKETELICLDEEGVMYGIRSWNVVYKISRGLPWKVAKVLYAGHKKHTPEECILALLPREMLNVIIQSCNNTHIK